MKRFELMLILVITILSAKDPGTQILPQKPVNSQGTPDATLLNINNFSSWYKNNTQQERDPRTGNAGLTYPRGTAKAIYTSGLMYGGILNDNGLQSLKVNGFSYNSGFYPGAILGIRTGIAENQADPGVRIWRIRNDFATADLRQDAAEFFSYHINSVTEAQIEQVRNQYKTDWIDWPAAKGAPYTDKNKNGMYDPKFKLNANNIEVPDTSSDMPGLANADQVIWFVANDLGGNVSPWQRSPIGLEQQVTIWGYNRSGAMGNIIFKKIKLIFKGLSSMTANAKIENMYLTHWSDPDMGDAGDDFAGCDTVLSLGYIYNAKSQDTEYLKYNLSPPAIGFDFLQGPIVASPNDTAVFDLKYRTGYKNLPMTSFVYFAAGGVYSDPPFTYNGGTQWYQMMRGLPPVPIYPEPPPITEIPAPIINPVTGKPTYYWLSGDPVLGTGWIDGMIEGPSDRRFLQTSGPFTMAVGDTQEIVVGVVGGMGLDRLNSIVKMRLNDRFVQFTYDNLFEIIPPDYSITLSDLSPSDAKISIVSRSIPGHFSSIGAILKRQNGSVAKQLTLFDDGAHGDEAAHDGIFANFSTISKESTPLSLSAVVTDKYNRTQQIDNVEEFVTVAGQVAVTVPTVFYDSYNTDGQVSKGEYIRYGVTIQNNTIFDLTGLSARPLADYEGHSVIAVPDLISSGSYSMTYNEFNFSSYFSLRIPSNYSGTTYDIPILITDGKFNSWIDTISFPISSAAFRNDLFMNVGVNIVGNNDAQVAIRQNNPDYAGRAYDLWFGVSGSQTDWTLVRNLEGSDYATQHALFSQSNTVPLVTNAPSAEGMGSFTLNDALSSVAYSISLQGLSGAVTGAGIYAGGRSVIGKLVKPLTFTGTALQGVWQKNDAAYPLTDSIITEFTAGRLYVNVATAAKPGGEIRGQIDQGLFPRQSLYTGYSTSGIPSPLTQYEYTMNGFSLYVAAPYYGMKYVRQTEPTMLDVRLISNPEQTYYVSFRTGGGLGSKSNETDISIRFNGETNFAMAFPPVASPSPSMAYFIKVPFAVYKDTVRVWPVIMNARYTDYTWDTDSSKFIVGANQYPTFDQIYGIVDISDGSNNDLTYYSPLNTIFPPTSISIKGRYLNSNNHIASSIYFVNIKKDNIPPPSGTKVVLSPSRQIKNGDIKRFTLQTLGVERNTGAPIPGQYSLDQNYPNPFNPLTTISFSLPVSGKTVVKIYDLIGREVSVLVDEVLVAGKYTVQCNAARFASGVYFYRLEAGTFVQTRKMVLLK